MLFDSKMLNFYSDSLERYYFNPIDNKIYKKVGDFYIYEPDREYSLGLKAFCDYNLVYINPSLLTEIDLTNNENASDVKKLFDDPKEFSLFEKMPRHGSLPTGSIVKVKGINQEFMVKKALCMFLAQPVLFFVIFLALYFLRVLLYLLGLKHLIWLRTHIM